jgi:hypothetical protein
MVGPIPSPSRGPWPSDFTCEHIKTTMNLVSGRERCASDGKYGAK